MDAIYSKVAKLQAILGEALIFFKVASNFEYGCDLDFEKVAKLQTTLV